VEQRPGEPERVLHVLRPRGGIPRARLTLTLSRTEDSGEMLEKIRERTASSSPGNPLAVKHVAYFKVVETRPLV